VFFFYFVAYLPEDGQKRAKHAVGLLCGFMCLYQTAVQVLESAL
jgi:hypothetical protein